MRKHGIFIFSLATTLCAHNPLRVAILSSDVATVNAMLQQQSTPALIDLYRLYNTHPRFDLLAMTLLFLTYRTDIYEKSPDDYTPLHYAAAHNCADAIRVLIHAYPTNCRSEALNAQDIHGKTPLHYAASCQKIEATRALLRHGASPSIQDNEGITPLMIARASQNDALINRFRLAHLRQRES